MDIILLEKVRNLGNLGDRVEVRRGYGRNFLLPKRMAVPATKLNLEKFEARREELELRAQENLKEAHQRKEAISAVGSVSIPAKAAEEGKLYGSVSITDIVEALQKANIKIHRSEVKMPAGPIRYIGEYDINIYLHSDVITAVKVNVIHE